MALQGKMTLLGVSLPLVYAVVTDMQLFPPATARGSISVYATQDEYVNGQPAVKVLPLQIFNSTGDLTKSAFESKALSDGLFPGFTQVATAEQTVIAAPSRSSLISNS